MLDRLFYKKSKPLKIFKDLMPAKLDIYNELSFHYIATNPYISSEILQESNKEVIHFKLSGELSGHIVCTITADKRIENTQFKSMMLEGINILLGKFLTKLDQSANLLCMIDSPKKISLKQLEFLSTCQFKIISNTLYLTKSKKGNTKVNILFHANKENTRNA